VTNYILLIFEGEKTEKIIFKNLKKYYFQDIKNTIILNYYCNDIYNFYKQLSKDPDLELFPLLQEKLKNSELSNITRDDVSEIFLFFDYDGHATLASDKTIDKLLHFFNEETENGKLYLSYPMVESLKHLNKDIDFKDVLVDAKINIHYKNLVSNACDKCYINFSKLELKHWHTILNEHCKKLNYLMTDEFEFPTDLTSQSDIFNKQKLKYIIPNNKVAVLSAFPIFIADYYGYKNKEKLFHLSK